ncbi:uncharacterized protein DS421_11g327960 [Arachis hypogaea]|nr:uncharacterized protein DS421_11g327960 [Arachis hypogaea]
MDARDPDINCLNASWHIAGAINFERPRLLLPRRVSHTLAPPDAIIHLREAEFGDTMQFRDFVFDNSLITPIVERWRPETHTFYLPSGECTITLQNVAYHLELRTYGEPVGFIRQEWLRGWKGSMQKWKEYKKLKKLLSCPA